MCSAKGLNGPTGATTRQERLPGRSAGYCNTLTPSLYMLIMNKLGVNVLQYPADLPGRRSWRVVAPVGPLSPFAEHIFDGYLELTAPLHNNIKRVQFTDRPERSETGDM